MSEKLDGVRAYWDGKSLISRLGNRFHAPDWFLEGLPEIPLDGELWIGRKAFQRTVGIVRRQDKTDLWKEVRYVVFDAPGDRRRRSRSALAAVRDHVERHRPPYLAAHEHAICQGLDHLRAELARVEALGGEGLMLRQPGSRYEVGRSLTLLKVKSFRDAEARVLEHLKGAGRHKGRLGRAARGAGRRDAVLGRHRLLRRRARGAAAGRLRHHLPLPGALRRRRAALPVVRRRPGRLSCPARADPPAPATPRDASALRPDRPRRSRAARRFELVEGSSSKFWEVARDGCAVTVRYGRIGGEGRPRPRNSPTKSGASHAEGLIAEKVGKGYAPA